MPCLAYTALKLPRGREGYVCVVSKGANAVLPRVQHGGVRCVSAVSTLSPLPRGPPPKKKSQIKCGGTGCGALPVADPAKMLLYNSSRQGPLR